MVSSHKGKFPMTFGCFQTVIREMFYGEKYVMKEYN